MSSQVMTGMPKLLVLRPRWGGQDLEFHHVRVQVLEDPLKPHFCPVLFLATYLFQYYFLCLDFAFPWGA